MTRVQWQAIGQWEPKSAGAKFVTYSLLTVFCGVTFGLMWQEGLKETVGGRVIAVAIGLSLSLWGWVLAHLLEIVAVWLVWMIYSINQRVKWLVDEQMEVISEKRHRLDPE